LHGTFGYNLTPANGVLPESIVKVADNFDDLLSRLYDQYEKGKIDVLDV